MRRSLKLMPRRCVNKTVANISLYLYLAVLIGAIEVGSLHAGEEFIILDKAKQAALAEWDKPVHFGTGNWKVVDDAEDQAIKLRADSSSFALEKSIMVGVEGDGPAGRRKFFFSRHRRPGRPVARRFSQDLL